jgi:hypothetical protein
MAYVTDLNTETSAYLGFTRAVIPILKEGDSISVQKAYAEILYTFTLSTIFGLRVRTYRDPSRQVSERYRSTQEEKHNINVGRMFHSM